MRSADSTLAKTAGPGLHAYCVTGSGRSGGEADDSRKIARAPDGRGIPAGGGGRRAGDDAIRGVGEGPVQTLALGPIVLWIERLDAPPSPSVESLRRHHEVVETACSHGPCLPLRFGSWFTAESRLREAFEARKAVLAEGLRRVAGCREFAVRILSGGPSDSADARDGDPGWAERPADPPPQAPQHPGGRAPSGEPAPATAGAAGPAVGPGTRHLLGLAGREAGLRKRARRAEALSRELEIRLEGHLRAVHWEPLEPPGGIAAIAHLVAEESIPEYREGVDGWIREREDLRVVRAGPWPPYSFTP